MSMRAWLAGMGDSSGAVLGEDAVEHVHHNTLLAPGKLADGGGSRPTAGIADAGIERPKAKVSLAQLVEPAGVVLEKRGQDHVGRSPFARPLSPANNPLTCTMQ